jgi:hypothetical protein
MTTPSELIGYNDFLKGLDQIEEEGSKCEISLCDARLNVKGDRVYLYAGTKRSFDTSLTEDNRASTLVLTKYYTQDGYVEYTETEVLSSYIKEAIR